MYCLIRSYDYHNATPNAAPCSDSLGHQRSLKRIKRPLKDHRIMLLTYFDIDRANARTSIRVRTTTPPRMLVMIIICFRSSSIFSLSSYKHSVCKFSTITSNCLRFFRSFHVYHVSRKTNILALWSGPAERF